jgi:serine/threonine protein phosphatase PrpC
MSRTPRNRKITIKMDNDSHVLNLNLNLNSAFRNNLYRNQKRQNTSYQKNINYKQTLVSYNRLNESRNNNRVYNNMPLTSDQFTFNPNKILNYINDDQTYKLNRFNNNNNENLDKVMNDKNNNLDKMNKTNSNNFNIINPNATVNLHIDNNGKMINDHNNNVNNDIDKLYVYKYDISQNNIISRNNESNTYELNNSANNKKENQSYIRNNNSSVDLNNQNKNNKNDSNCIIKEITRNNSSFRPNNLRLTIINHTKADRYNHLKMIQSKQDSNTNITPNNIMNETMIKIKKKNPVIKPIRKIHQFTHIGFNGESDKDFNQDIAFVERKFAGDNIFIFLGVCDGHGVHGHEISDFLRNNLPKELSKSLNHKDLETKDIKLKKNIFNVIESTFIKINNMVTDDESINTYFSGTTCVSVIYTPKKLICANVGDSRAVLGRYEKHTKKWVPLELSRDHKPTEPDEATRILNRGGRIKPFIDEQTGEEFGPKRIWVKNEDVPGLAMTRSFGDSVAASVGCICLPEIKEFEFDEGDKFLILASDGIWEFIESEECINIIGKYYNNNNIEECCNYLYTESRKRWIKEEEVVDDITLILVFFD